MMVKLISHMNFYKGIQPAGSEVLVKRSEKGAYIVVSTKYYDTVVFEDPRSLRRYFGDEVVFKMMFTP